MGMLVNTGRIAKALKVKSSGDRENRGWLGQGCGGGGRREEAG